MRIQAINNFCRKINFGEVEEGYDEPCKISREDKIDLIYKMLKEQKQDLITLSKNQYKMHKCNANASMTILDNICNEGSSYDRSHLGKSFDTNRINIIS